MWRKPAEIKIPLFAKPGSAIDYDLSLFGYPAILKTFQNLRLDLVVEYCDG